METRANRFIYEPDDNIIYSQDVLIELNKLIMLMKKSTKRLYVYNWCR